MSCRIEPDDVKANSQISCSTQAVRSKSLGRRSDLRVVENPPLVGPSQNITPSPFDVAAVRAWHDGMAAPLLTLKRVGRTYGSGFTACVALKEITVEVPAGAFLAVVGPSGSGKTTLLNLISGLEYPTSGVVEIAGRDLGAMDSNEISELRLRKIGFVFQTFNLIPVLSVAENVEFPLLFRRELSGAERTKRVAEILARVGLADKTRQRPYQLSGGERQRVALARAIAGKPSILLADEPTANLDQETGAAVINLMHSLNRELGMTAIYASHDPQLVNLANSVLRLRDGQLWDDIS